MTIKSILIFCVLLFASACATDNSGDSESPEVNDKIKNKVALFSLVDPNSSGFNYVNKLEEDKYFNIFSYQYAYNGNGVAVGDINNDSLPDIFMGGNFIGGQLFLNKGKLNFNNISKTAGVMQKGFTTGVCMVDINADGWLDIYLCRSLSKDIESRRNVLLINNHNNTFTDKAKEFGLDDPGFSQNAAFFDYDNDGDLDMYLLNHRYDFPNTTIIEKSVSRSKEESEHTSDKLYRNNGNNTFTEVTSQSGIKNSSFSLHVSVSDINNDGWQDLYISCDYADKDHLYINNGNGTFTDEINKQLFHISRNTMGTDIADINNDGLLDILTTDMVAEDCYRQKLLTGPVPYDLFQLTNDYGLHYQVMRNLLQLNNGNNTFSEIGQMAGISHTDWTWAPLFSDFDNDGFKDLFIANGYFRDVTDMDYTKYLSNIAMQKAGKIGRTERFGLLKEMKQTPVLNYVYRNKGDLTFERTNTEWGMVQKSYSNGIAFADLDLDGDMEIIANNLNEPAFLYKNNSRELNPNNNFLQIQLYGGKFNTKGFDAKVWLINGDEFQVEEMHTHRGFLSSVEPILHFGTGNNKTIAKLVVKWNNNKMQVFENVKANQRLYLSMDNAKENFVNPMPIKEKHLLEKTTEFKIDYNHTENKYNDFKHEPLMELMYSNMGPYMTKGDVNGDGKEDIYIGGAAGMAGKLFINNSNGFSLSTIKVFDEDKEFEDQGCLFFDSDGDKDLDLYVCSGGNEMKDSVLLQDRLYINEKGEFARSKALPNNCINSTCVSGNDFDEDGDIDLFIGGGVINGKYPLGNKSCLLENKNGKFSDASIKLPANGSLGIITCAVWNDVVGKDNKKELILAGHWTGVHVLTYNGKSMVPVNGIGTNGIDKTSGWWNSITAGDFDKDGDTDFVLGNRGTNSFYKASSQFPAHIFYNDFDENGSIDAIPCYFFNDKKLYPKHTLDELFMQLPMIRRKYNSYGAFSAATIYDIFTSEQLPENKHKSVSTFASSVLENTGNGNFKLKALPNHAQFSVTQDILVKDLNADGYEDLIIVGNQYKADVVTGLFDANIGMILLNDKKGNFNALPANKSGFSVLGDSRKITSIEMNKKTFILITLNNGKIQLFKLKDEPNI